MPQAWDNPDAFVGRVTLSAYEPYPANTGSNYSSINNTSLPLIHWNLPSALGVKSLIMEASFAAGVPGATSQASTGSEAYTYGYSAFLYSRQDYSANSTNLSPVVSGSLGITANMGYSSTSQTFGMSWNTDATGGFSSVSASSADAGWSNFINGARALGIPLSTTLPAGEYWAAFQHSSTAASSNSNVVLLSASQLLAGGFYASHGPLGATTTGGSAGTIGQPGNWLVWATAAPVFSTTVPITSGIVAGQRILYFNLRNA